MCEGALVLQCAVAVREHLAGISPLLAPSPGIELGSSGLVVSAFTCSAIVPVLLLHFQHLFDVCLVRNPWSQREIFGF